MSEYSTSGMEFIATVNKQHQQMEIEAARKHNGVFHDPIYARPSHEDFMKYRSSHPLKEPQVASPNVFEGMTDLKVTKPAGAKYYLDLLLYGRSEREA